MAWITPVTNRANTATYGYEDLNRVGEDVQFLADVLNLYGYAVTVTAKTDWSMTDNFNVDSPTAYLADIATLKAAFYGTIETPTTILTAEQANNIELLLEEIETNITNMITAFRHSGVTISGMGGLIT